MRCSYRLETLKLSHDTLPVINVLVQEGGRLGRLDSARGRGRLPDGRFPTLLTSVKEVIYTACRGHPRKEAVPPVDT